MNKGALMAFNDTIKRDKMDKDSFFIGKDFAAHLTHNRVAAKVCTPDQYYQSGVTERAIGQVVRDANTLLRSSGLAPEY